MPIMRPLALLCTLSLDLTHAQAPVTEIGLMDRALAGIASLVAEGVLSGALEEQAVRKTLQGDAGLMALTRQFGDSPSYARLLRSTLGGNPNPVAPAPAAALEVLAARRSIKDFNPSKPVPETTLSRALEAAILAPNHFLNEPWRFYVLGPKARADAVALNPAKADAFGHVPGWMVVTVAASEYAADGSIGTKKGLEDHAATACAIQNFMLAMAAAGVGTKWMTGALGTPPERWMELVGANATAERFMGVVWYGYPAKDLATIAAPSRKKGLVGVLTRLE